jgi:DNA processing protein
MSLSVLTPLTRAPMRQLCEEPEHPIEVPALVPDRDCDRIVAALGPAPVDIDSLVRGTGLSIRSVQIALMELSLAGRIERHGGGMVSLAPGP